MKITKFVHSCFLIETEDTTTLVDPGVFSWKSGSFDIDSIEKIDTIVITHQHPDHCFPEFINTVLAKFPDAEFVCNDEVAKTLKEAGIEANVVGSETNDIKSFESPHESIKPFGGDVQNTGYHLHDTFSTPGDSHSFTETKDVLAMPFVAPWGAPLNGVRHVLSLENKPKYVIPVHDWFFAEGGKQWLTERLERVLGEENIEVVNLGPGESFEIN